MQYPTDPDLMTPEERLAEIGRILGRGYLRYRAARRLAQSKDPAEQARLKDELARLTFGE